jgi:hypothetical protein
MPKKKKKPQLEAEGRRTDLAFEYNFYRDGITTGLLGNFLHCRQHADYYLDGWTLKEDKLYRIFGHVVHRALELINTKVMTGRFKKPPGPKSASKYVKLVENEWRADNTRVSSRILQDFEFCLGCAEALIPEYYKYWWSDFHQMHWEGVEKEFDIPWLLNDKKTKTRFRGKRDGEFVSKADGGLWLFETKTASQVREGALFETLELNFQLRNYCVSLKHDYDVWPEGAWYNIIRRPALRQRQTEDLVDFMNRITEDVKSRPEFYFQRIEVPYDRLELSLHEKALDALINDFHNWWKGTSPHYPSYECSQLWGACDFTKGCRGEELRLHYRVRPRMFTELEADQ